MTTVLLDRIEFVAIFVGCPLLFWLKEELMCRMGWKTRRHPQEQTE